MKIFVTGASGELGRYLVNYLGQYHQVCALSRSTPKSLDFDNPNVKAFQFTNFQDIDDYIKSEQPDVVMNCVTCYGRNGEGIDKLISANIDFPSTLLERCAPQGIKLFLNIGTSLPENLSTYSSTKNCFVKLSKHLYLPGVKFVNARLEHFFGPSTDNRKFSNYVFNCLTRNIPVDCTTAKQKRDFIYVNDVCQILHLLIENIDSLKNWEEIDVGTGQSMTIKSFIETAKATFNSSSTVNYGSVKLRKDEPLNLKADVTRLKELGWKGATPFEVALKLVHRDIRSA